MMQQRSVKAFETAPRHPDKSTFWLECTSRTQMPQSPNIRVSVVARRQGADTPPHCAVKDAV
ncbi:hypothetical protein IAQ61_008412 [Plenodomus lingam]|uniref:uncharacterized protein n=1 Tax=Leptosphaeria maculans TaxID=5022 RepID=UPI00332B55DC|nr:hypothetical protein IAQ61_008412 [Plenodomus lingam]